MGNESSEPASERTDEERSELPIERGFPIERVNEIAQKESRAKQWYRPIYTMHKWWARRLGCVFRAICLYALLDDPEKVEVHEPGRENETLSDFEYGETDVATLVKRVDMTVPESLWELYSKDVRVEDVFVDLLETPDPSYDDVNKLCRGTSAKPEDLEELRLYAQDDGFELGTWDDDARIAYVQERVNGEGGEHLTNLDKLQFLRYRYEEGKKVGNYVDKWTTGQDARDLATRLADATGDETYLDLLGDRDLTNY